MKSFSDIAKELFPKNYAVFVSGDVGVSSLQRELAKYKAILLREKQIDQKAYESSEGVFLRCSKDDQRYSGIIQAKERGKRREMLFSIPPKLQEGGFEVLTIFKVPLERVPSFPLLSVIDKQSSANRKALAQQYWKKFDDDIDALKSWYLDLLKYRRELVFLDFPQIASAVPSWISKHDVFVLYNEKSRAISTRYYRNPRNEDTVLVSRTEEPIGPGSDALSRIFKLPAKENAISEGWVFNSENEKVYSNWEHPFFAATEELGKELKNFNSVQKPFTFSAYDASESLVSSWTYQEINKRRELARRYPFLEGMFKDWVRPVQVLVRYNIEAPTESRVTDGSIAATYVHGLEDRIVVERVKSRADIMYSEELTRKYFPPSTEIPFYGFQSVLLHYLSDKFGYEY
jgi:hypothetical protein